LLEDDILELEGVMHLCLIFVSHKPTPMYKDFFWSIVHPKTNVGSICDPDKTTIPHTEHKRDLICRIIRVEVNNANQDADHEHHDKDDGSEVSKDMSICNNNSEGKYIQGIDDEDSDDDVTNEDRATRLLIVLKNLGNMSCKPVDRHATTNLFATGHEHLQKGLTKSA
jgi:hypothetical protein